jgi:hypothetical protein
MVGDVLGVTMLPGTIQVLSISIAESTTFRGLLGPGVRQGHGQQSGREDRAGQTTTNQESARGSTIDKIWRSRR